MNKYEVRRINLLKIKREKCQDKNVILANVIDKDPTYVSRMLYPEGKVGKKNIAEDMAEHIEKRFNLSNGWLDIPDANFNIKVESKHFNVHSYPFFTKVQAGSFHDIGMQYTDHDAIKFIETLKAAHEDAFWLEVSGNSMTSPNNGKPSFPEGMIILVDPGQEVHDGDFCVAMVNNEATFKRFRTDAGVPYLEPLNPSSDLIKLNDEYNMIGKVIEAKWEYI